MKLLANPILAALWLAFICLATFHGSVWVSCETFNERPACVSHQTWHIYK